MTDTPMSPAKYGILLAEGDCREWLNAHQGPLFDSCVTDPPYELGFMGKGWDKSGVAFDPETWRVVFDRLKPGGHLVAFSGTRTYHRMACAIEDAGFEIRDQLAWAYGSGFPKSLDVSKAIDKEAGAERTEKIGPSPWNARKPNGSSGVNSVGFSDGGRSGAPDIMSPATDDAKQWSGWGTALKPAYEPICWAQKPFSQQQLFALLVPTVWEQICEVDSFAKTDTCLSEPLRASGFLSIATSFRNNLAALLPHASTFTIETATALTTDLKTLNSFLSRIMHAITTGAAMELAGVVSDVWVVGAISKNAQANCERLVVTTAGEIAIDWRVEKDVDPAGNRFLQLWEPICLARKPLDRPNVAANVLEHGTGALNVDGCRIESGERPHIQRRNDKSLDGNVYGSGINGSRNLGVFSQGRFPANLCHDGSPEVVDGFPSEAGAFAPVRGTEPSNSTVNVYGARDRVEALHHGDKGSAARFFYSAKAGPLDRIGSGHATVKPVDLMRWLVRLVTPPGGVILDPFAGSGTTGIAALAEGFGCQMIELEPEHCRDIERKLAYLRGEGRARVVEHDRKRDEPQSNDDLPLFGGSDDA